MDYLEDDDDGMIIPEIPEEVVEGAYSDCCNAPTKTIEGMLTCTECGDLCSPR